MNKEIKERLEKTEKEIAIHDGLIHDIYGTLIEMLDKNIAQDMKRIEHLEPTAKGARRLYHFAEAELVERKSKETNSKILKALRKAAIDADWLLSDATEILGEICYQGFCYPESINILREVMATSQFDPRTDSKFVWELALTKIIEERQKHIQEYERRKSFEKTLHRGLLKTITISVEGVDPSIKISNPQQASAKNNNMGDADYAIELLEEWDDEMAFALRGNMKII